MKKKFVFCTMMMVLLVLGLAFIGCPQPSNNPGNSDKPTKPAPLPDNADYDQAQAKVSEIIRYCEATAPTNDRIKGGVQSAFSDLSQYKDMWSIVGSSCIEGINDAISGLK